MLKALMIFCDGFCVSYKNVSKMESKKREVFGG